MKNEKLSKYFTLYEFVKPETTITTQVRGNLIFLAKNLDVIREALKKPIIITSGYRSPEHNRKVGGAKFSAHLEGKAADITTPHLTNEELWYFCKRFWRGRIESLEATPTWVHLDTRQWGKKIIFKP